MPAVLSAVFGGAAAVPGCDAGLELGTSTKSSFRTDVPLGGPASRASAAASAPVPASSQQARISSPRNGERFRSSPQ